MVEILLNWLVLSVAIWAAARLLSGVHIVDLWTAAGVAAVFGLLNWAFGWLLFVAIGIGTLGLGFLLAFISHWIVNSILLYVSDALVKDFRLESFGWAMVASLLISAFATIGHWIVY